MAAPATRTADGAPTEVGCCPPLGPSPLDLAAAERLAEVGKALADPVRVRLLSLVATATDGEACACDLPAAVDRSQSTVSHHLSHLVAAGLLRREQRGRWAWFTVDHDALRDVARALDLQASRRVDAGADGGVTDGGVDAGADGRTLAGTT